MAITDADIDAFLEHHGVKGMHWGVRGTRRTQKILDRLDRASKGKASRTDKLLNANRFVFSKKGAQKNLMRGAMLQEKVKAGKAKTSNILATATGIKIKDLNYHQSDSPLTKQQKQETRASILKGEKRAKIILGASVGVIVVNGVIKVAQSG